MSTSLGQFVPNGARKPSIHIAAFLAYAVVTGNVRLSASAQQSTRDLPAVVIHIRNSCVDGLAQSAARLLLRRPEAEILLVKAWRVSQLQLGQSSVRSLSFDWALASHTLLDCR